MPKPITATVDITERNERWTVGVVYFSDGKAYYFTQVTREPLSNCVTTFDSHKRTYLGAQRMAALQTAFDAELELEARETERAAAKAEFTALERAAELEGCYSAGCALDAAAEVATDMGLTSKADFYTTALRALPLTYTYQHNPHVRAWFTAHGFNV